MRKKAVVFLLGLFASITTLIAVSTPALAVTKLTQAQAASRLSGAGITWSSSGGCTDRNNAHCTSFDQINSGTVDTMITLKSASGCAINITGGTETGHASGTYSHWNGYKVDTAHNSCLDGYIRTASPTSACAATATRSGRRARATCTATRATTGTSRTTAAVASRYSPYSSARGIRPPTRGLPPEDNPLFAARNTDNCGNFDTEESRDY